VQDFRNWGGKLCNTNSRQKGGGQQRNYEKLYLCKEKIRYIVCKRVPSPSVVTDTEREGGEGMQSTHANFFP